MGECTRTADSGGLSRRRLRAERARGDAARARGPRLVRGVVVAGLVVLATGWAYADPIAGLLIGVLLVLSTFGVLRETVGVLLEGTPRGMDAREAGAAIASVEGVVGVHDLHLWTITSGFPALSAHVLVAAGADCHAIRRELELLLRDRFALTHTTLQVEHAPGPIELAR
ncbi:MAG: cation diffusion facilitator family transporter [Gaiellaceae bacterium]